MKAFPTHPDPAAEDAAALWAAQLDGSTLEEADWAALDLWLSRDPSHRALLSRYCEFSAELEERLPALRAATLAPAREEPRSRVLPRLAWAGLGLAAAAAVAAGIWLGWPRPRFEEIATPAGQRQTLTLADGTRLELSARTRFGIEFSGSERRVRLAEGEAYLQVAPDEERPFVVETPMATVRVLGTAFDARTQAAGELEITVVTGSVSVQTAADNQAAVVLRAGFQLTARDGGSTTRPLAPAEIDDVLAWRQGRIVFHGVPLREALARLAYYQGRSITAAPEAANLRLGGVFSLDDPDGFFAALEEVLPVRVTRDGYGGARVDRRPRQ